MKCWGTARCRSMSWTRRSAAGLIARRKSEGSVALLGRKSGSVRIARHVRAAVPNEEVEIGSFIRLLDVLDVKPQPAAVWKRRWRPLGAACGEDVVVNLQ